MFVKNVEKASRKKITLLCIQGKFVLMNNKGTKNKFSVKQTDFMVP